MTTLTVQEAKSINIFHLEGGEIKENNLYDFVMESAEEITSPRGVETKLHTRFIKDEDPEHEYDGKWCVYEWIGNGRHPQLRAEFDEMEEAEDYIFQQVYEYNFLPDDQRDCEYWNSYEEAEAARKERAS